MKIKKFDKRISYFDNTQFQTIKQFNKRSKRPTTKTIMSVPTAEIQTFLSSLQNVIGEFAKTLDAEPKRKKIVKKASKKAKVEKAEKEEPKKRGRPAKAKAEKEEPKKSGRPAKAKAEKEEPKKRGRPAKVKAEKEETSVPKRRGRPPKTKAENVEEVVDAAKALVEMSQKSAPKKRGRPTKPENVGKPKPQRKAPQASAKDFEIGDSMTGLDGLVWIVAQRAKTGGLYWKKAFLLEDN